MTSWSDPVPELLPRLLAGGLDDVPPDELDGLSRAACASGVAGPTLRALGRWFPRRAAGDESALARLEEARIDTAARAAWLDHEARGISRGMCAAGIEHRLVKGLALRPHLAHPGDRWMDDIDVLVPARHRARAIAHLRSRGATARRGVRHDARRALPERDGRSVEHTSTGGAPLDVHFTTRALPAEQHDARPSLPDTVIALAEHALVHHRGAPLFVCRMVADLRLVLDLGHLEALLSAAERSRALASALATMKSLGAPELRGVSLRHVSLRIDRVRRDVGACLALAGEVGAWRLIMPTRAYLEAHEGGAAVSSIPALHARRWGRVVRWLAT